MLNVNENSNVLNDDQLKSFDDDGFLVFPNYLDGARNQLLKEAVDSLETARHTGNPLIIDVEELGYFTSYPKTMSILNQLFGAKNFSMHHIHALRQDSNYPEVTWHHDYEQFPQTNRSHLMVHIFYYLNGMNGEIGDLLVLPGSQKTISQRHLSIFGTEDLPGSKTISSLSPGSMIIVNSAMLHARRAKPGGEDNPRYFVDISYCEKGILWPGYGYGNCDYQKINKIAKSKGYDRNGEYSHLYDSNDFLSKSIIENKNNELQGSLI